MTIIFYMVAYTFLRTLAKACDDVSPTTTVPAPSQLTYGITFDDPYKSSAIVATLAKLPKKITARVVFDEGIKAKEYISPVTAIHKAAFVMGEILDSEYVGKETAKSYTDRTFEYYSALSPYVDIWEIGNEVNGEWLGTTANVVAKIQGAYDLIKLNKGKTALTLYYNAGCYEKKANEMFTWASSNVPANMKAGLDYVLISYYEDDCNKLKPDWGPVFHKLALMFPNSKIGFGEVGTEKGDKAAYMTRYYSLKIDEPSYIGGYFWWYGSEDLVPSTKPLFSVFSNVIK